MEKEIKVRKKRFAAFWIAVLMVCTLALPIMTNAADYPANEVKEKLLQEGDKLTYSYVNGDGTADTFKVYYQNYLGEALFNEDAGNGYLVKAYSESLPQDGSFEGWYVTSVSGSGDEVYSVTLHARISFPIEYVTTGTHSNPDRYVYGEGVDGFTVASKAGYAFGGWYWDAAYTQKADSISTTHTGKVILYAELNENPSHSIEYVLDGGSNGNNPTSYVEGLGTALEAASKVGYSFDGWYKTSDFSGTPLTAIDINEIGDIALYAKFTVNQYTITFNTASDSEIASITQDYGTTITAPGNPTRENYYFMGWDTAIPDTMPAENLTITAKWTPYVINAGTYDMKQGVEYKLGSATKVSGDSSTYVSGSIFYVPEDGSYTFS